MIQILQIYCKILIRDRNRYRVIHSSVNLNIFMLASLNVNLSVPIRITGLIIQFVFTSCVKHLRTPDKSRQILLLYVHEHRL